MLQYMRSCTDQGELYLTAFPDQVDITSKQVHMGWHAGCDVVKWTPAEPESLCLEWNILMSERIFKTFLLQLDLCDP